MRIKVLKNNEVIFVGNNTQVCEKFGIKDLVLQSKIRYRNAWHGLRFRIARNEDDLYKETKMLLLRYGNTNLKDDPTEIVKRLKEEGIEVEVEHYDPFKQRNITGVGTEKFEEDWILTLKEVKQ